VWLARPCTARKGFSKEATVATDGPTARVNRSLTQALQKSKTHIMWMVRTPCRYNEKLSVLGGTLITAHPSGFAIGSCNWSIRSPELHFVHVTASAEAANRHPAPIDVASHEHHYHQPLPVCMLSCLSVVDDAYSGGVDCTGPLAIFYRMSPFCCDLKRCLWRRGQVTSC
jgi:hypothetical protein